MTKQQTFLGFLASRVGVVEAARVAAFLATYGTTVRLRGGERVTMEDYADDWHMSHRKAYRDLTHYRAAVPAFRHPYDLLVALRATQGAGSLSGALERAPKVLGWV